ncbi:MAG: tRNA (adenosine(37)-N6)-threonylcarbamoyltransferase complex ATPase subunit type 1 TsaE [Bacteroidetes bacterium GWA2_32_17]|nr:MAG: tRNA (adenosine(37)-N6)-threonylcarbamoyltransferase complex ATPase subunit type 1 TsaE [Bacteroidetes bacterium GWA2_32_17]
MISFKVKSLEELNEAAAWVLQNIGNNKIVAFYTEMGAGKTTLIKEICKQLNCMSNVTSPTYTIVNEYNTFENNSIFHFDFYRLSSTKEIIDIGFEEYINSENYCFIEWPELAEALLPINCQKINIKVDEKQNRLLTLYV